MFLKLIESKKKKKIKYVQELSNYKRAGSRSTLRSSTILLSLIESLRVVTSCHLHTIELFSMNKINIFCAEVEEKADVAANIRNKTTPRPSDGRREDANGEVIANL